MKVHRNLALAVVAGLKDILLEKKQADFIVSNLLQSNSSWGARDRNFIAENIYGVVRYKRLYEFCIEDELFGEVSIWKLFGTRLLLEGLTLPAWNEFAALDYEKIVALGQQAKAIRRVRESIPDWLDQLGVQELGENWENEIHALNQQAKFCIRVNTLKTTRQQLIHILRNDGIEFSESDIAPDALVLHSKKNLKNYLPYKNGFFEVQDVSSQLVAPFLLAAPGMSVIDGCAGAGGKTLHLAALMQNRGEILAVDVQEKKLEELQRRALRAGCRIIKTHPAEKLTRHRQALLQSTADRILLDVPCSGLGVLRRKPDAKWSLTSKFLQELKQTQAQILDEYAPMLKPGGMLVYSTCSIFPSENEQQVQAFTARNKGFQLVEEKRLSPAQTGFDGFYIARLLNKG